MEMHLMNKVKKISLILSVLIFINILFGPLVRATNSGLACPDWPLCYGRVLPPAEFRIWMEVGHRFYSGGISIFLLYLAFIVVKNPSLRKTFGGSIALASVVILIQIVLGALTVTKLLDPTTVNLHLLNAVLLLITVVTVYLKSRTISLDLKLEVSLPSLFKKGVVLAFFIFILIYFQLYMGGRVSSNYAGLVCPDWPLCQGSWIPKPFAGPVKYHVEHRFTAYLLFALVLLRFLQSIYLKVDRKDIFLSSLLLLFCFLQILIGIFNVLWGIPTLLTAIHTANGVAFLICSYLVLHHLLINYSQLSDKG